ncbi:senescence-associated carboxylesterase 101-like isoform X2 [Rhodamnia argentea]|uniref:Senescence-associated carboxylesterase 101-like isoform X2 n=1 Tax=Rhodamnia argentea TaxID=178133 RepID=A0ABM3H9X3_9MYRT|nr:senescence-associated carboxylesterase 101-like isoform X2 [Rhodamnia argentea]
MEPACRFSNGLYLANLTMTSSILMDSWDVISKSQPANHVELNEDHPDYKIIAIVRSPIPASYPKSKGQLVPIQEKSEFPLLCSATPPSLLINEDALDQFNALREDFRQLQEKIKPSSVPEASTSSTKTERKDPICYIITGHGLYGSVASLFTLWLLNKLDPTEFNLLCITFGSPLLGDTAFQQAVSRHLTWNSCFLHVVHKDDSVPRLYLVPPPADQSLYKPFGTFLLCSESGGACFQAPESIIELLKYGNQEDVAENQESTPIDYKNVIERLEEMHYESSFLGFGDELYLANLAVSSNLLKDLWNATSKLEGNGPVTIINDHPDYNIIAFDSSPVATSNLQQESSLVPESEISDSQFQCSDPHPYFWINKDAFSRFVSLRGKLSELLEEVITSSEPQASSSSAKKHNKKKPIPYIITGRGLNGSVASLFTQSLLSMLDPTKFKLLCITFGSPPLWDTTFHCVTFGSPPLWDTAFQPVSRLTWNSCFLHVLHKDDLVGRLFVVPQYKPHGTFLLCSELGDAYCQDPEPVIKRLKYEKPEAVAENQSSRAFDYKAALECLEKKLLERDYEAGITGQVTAVGLSERQQDGGISGLVKNIVAYERLVREQQREEFNPSQLEKARVLMAKLEWYINKCRNEGQGPGYYDSFKDEPELYGPEVIDFQSDLNAYWKKVVEDADKKPQLPNAPLRKRWLFAGTNYRRIVEPLDIAEYYRSRRRDYLTRERSNHYKKLEVWLEDHQKGTKKEKGRPDGPSKSKVVNVTEDSCFWAHVEEAILSCSRRGKTRAPPPSVDPEGKKPFNFGEHVMDLIERKKVSSDIFFEKSRYMQWWREYREMLSKKVEEVSHSNHSEGLVNYMEELRYKYYDQGPSTSGGPQG